MEIISELTKRVYMELGFPKILNLTDPDLIVIDRSIIDFAIVKVYITKYDGTLRGDIGHGIGFPSKQEVIDSYRGNMEAEFQKESMNL